jgi:hypothetical protein
MCTQLLGYCHKLFELLATQAYMLLVCVGGPLMHEQLPILRRAVRPLLTSIDSVIALEAALLT